VVLLKENHMQSTEAPTLDRKSGEAEGSAVPLYSLSNLLLEAFADLKSLGERLSNEGHGFSRAVNGLRA
jgi:hypothetical protein